MAVLGIVAEYDPLHNGHLYHLNEAKSLVKPDLTYVVLSPCMKQRGDLPLLSPLDRARLALEAGADAVMIHSRKKDPAEICEFIERFRKEDPSTPIVLVPTSFNSVTEEEWKERGANIIIYANQLMRAAVPAIRRAAESILTHHRAQECDDELMPFKEIIRLIPEE